MTSDQFPDIVQTMGDLLKNTTEEVKSNAARIAEAKNALIKAAEEKKAALAAAAAKKSKAGKKGARKDDVGAEEDQKTMTLKQSSEEDDGELNLNDPDDFAKALIKEVPRPFTFGPIEFTELNLTEEQKPFEVNQHLERIIECLDAHLAQPSCCIRGHTV